MKVKMALVVACLSGAVVAPSGAQPLPATFEKITGPQVQELLQEWGYRAELDKDDEGDPKVRTGMSGRNVQIYFYGCNRELAVRVCTSVQFYVGLKTTNKVDWSIINEWNRKKRYVKAYLTDTGAVHMEMDVPFTGGISSGALRNAVRLYETAIPEILAVLPD